jgi:hypothetical protein
MTLPDFRQELHDLPSGATRFYQYESSFALEEQKNQLTFLAVSAGRRLVTR